MLSVTVDEIPWSLVEVMVKKVVNAMMVNVRVVISLGGVVYGE